MKKSIYSLLVYHSIAAISPIYTIGAFATYWVTSVLMKPLLDKADASLGSALLGDSELEYIDLDTHEGAKILLTMMPSKSSTEEDL